jgi:pilus assembly protein FimV
MARHKKNRLHVAVLAGIASLNAHAVGMGEIAVRSKLNQPLRAEVPMIQLGSADIDQARIIFRPVDDIAVGSTNSSIVSKLSGRFVAQGGGQYQLQIRSSESIREPVVTFYIEVVLPSSHTRREFTVLLDPQVTAIPDAADAAPDLQARTVDFEAMEQSIAALSAPPGAKRDRSLRAEPPLAGTQAVAAPVERVPARKTGTLAGDTYGPVMPNETLWAIARRVRPNRSMTMQEVMARLLEANPDAFVNRDIDRLRVGVSLHIPDLTAAAESAAPPAQIAESAASGTTTQSVEPTTSVTTPAGTSSPTTSSDSVTTATEAAAPTGATTSSAASSAAAVATTVQAAATTYPAHDSTAAGAAAHGTMDATAEAMKAQLDTLAARIEELQNLANEREAQIAALQSTLGDLQNRLDAQTPVTAQGDAESRLALPVVAPAVERTTTDSAFPQAQATSTAVPGQGKASAANADGTTDTVDANRTEGGAPGKSGGWWAIAAVLLTGLGGAYAVLRGRRTTDEAARENRAALTQEDARLLREVAQKVSKPASTSEATIGIDVAPVMDLAADDTVTNLPTASHIVIDPSSDQNVSAIWDENSVPNWSLDKDAEETIALEPSATLDSPTLSPVEDEPPAHAAGKVVPLKFDSSRVEPILKEVDLQIAYLQFEDAERLLLEPLAEYPNEPALLVKLAEVHVAAGAVDKFVELAMRLSENEAFRNSEHWTRIARMGEMVAPTHPLFEFVATVEIAADEFGNIQSRA